MYSVRCVRALEVVLISTASLQSYKIAEGSPVHLPTTKWCTERVEQRQLYDLTGLPMLCSALILPKRCKNAIHVKTARFIRRDIWPNKIRGCGWYWATLHCFALQFQWLNNHICLDPHCPVCANWIKHGLINMDKSLHVASWKHLAQTHICKKTLASNSLFIKNPHTCIYLK